MTASAGPNFEADAAKLYHTASSNKDFWGHYDGRIFRDIRMGDGDYIIPFGNAKKFIFYGTGPG